MAQHCWSARRVGEIKKVSPETNVITGGGADYRYRARLPRERVPEKVSEAMRGITYPNFKSEVAAPSRHDAYMDVWSAMYRYQQGEWRPS